MTMTTTATIQDKLDKNVEFVCSLYKARFEKSKAVQDESLYHVTYTITCEDSHTIIFHANLFPKMFGMVINDLLNNNESSMIVETLENEDDYAEKVVSTLSGLMSYKKSEDEEDHSSADMYDLVGFAVGATKNATWEHKYGKDDIKKTSYDHFIININYEVTMTITLEYWADGRPYVSEVDILTFTVRTLSGTYEKKTLNTTISDAMLESVDFINLANRFSGGRMIK